MLAGTLYDVSSILPPSIRQISQNHSPSFPSPLNTTFSPFPSFSTTSLQTTTSQPSQFAPVNSEYEPIELPNQFIDPNTQNTPGIVRVIGYITDSQKGSFTLLAPKSGKVFSVSCPGMFCPVRRGDAISAVCQILAPGHLNLLQSPIVAMPTSNDTVIKSLYAVYSKDKQIKHLIPKLNNSLQSIVDQRIYTKEKSDGIDLGGKYEFDQKSMIFIESQLNNQPRFVTDVCELLTLFSTRWNDTKCESTLIPITDVLGRNPQYGEHFYAMKLMQWWYNNRIMRGLYLLGFNNKDINNICNDSGLSKNQLHDRLHFNPYTVPQVQFDKCLEIDVRTGRTPKVSDLPCGQIVRAIWDNYSKKKWMCTSVEWIRQKYPFFDTCRKCLKYEYGIVYDKMIVRDHSRNSVLNGTKKDDKRVTYAYLNRMYMAETSIVKFISARMHKEGEWKDPYPNTGFNIKVGPVSPFTPPNASDTKYDPDQIEAINMVAEGGVNALTGGAGVGKTTVLKEIVKNFELNKIPFVIACPTGMATSRVKEVIPGSNPMTLHRMIASPSKVPKFKRLIIDEASMVTDEIIYDLFRVFGTDFDLTLVGDSGQLPPIGAGSLFNEILLSRAVTKIVLKTCHRTRLDNGEMDGILLNCNRIAHWPDGNLYTPHLTNNFIMNGADETQVMQLIKSFKENKVGIEDFCIISPYNANLDNVNRFSQLIYNGSNKCVKDPRNKIWHEGDRVKMKVNNYDIEVMNGEQGIILSVSNDSVTVDFHDNRIVEIPFTPKKNALGGEKVWVNKYKTEENDNDEGDMSDLCTACIDLSFAITVHGSQGHEFLFVIAMMPHGKGAGSGHFLNRNLVYTMFSRARRFLFAIGDTTALCEAVGKGLPYRCERLMDRLRNCLPIKYEEEEQTQLDIFEDDYGDGFNHDAFDYMDM